MTTILELLSGVLRFFPNTMTVALFTLGILVGKISWVLVAIGGIIVAILAISLQSIFGHFKTFTPTADRFILEACSLLPVAREGWVYGYAPSVWFSMSAFFLTYILRNAFNVYTVSPAKVSSDATAVQQRKGVGLISIVAVAVLFIFLMIPRYVSPCETRIGTALGLALGGLWGWAWWEILNSSGSDVYPDIHGVMTGLRPGALRTGPLACGLAL